MSVRTYTETTCDRCDLKVEGDAPSTWKDVVFDGQRSLLCRDCYDALHEFLKPRKRRRRASRNSPGPRQDVAGATQPSLTMPENGPLAERAPTSAVAQAGGNAAQAAVPAIEPPRRRRGRPRKAQTPAAPPAVLEPVLEDGTVYLLRAKSCDLCRCRVALSLDGREHVMDRATGRREPCLAALVTA